MNYMPKDTILSIASISPLFYDGKPSVDKN